MALATLLSFYVTILNNMSVLIVCTRFYQYISTLKAKITEREREIDRERDWKIDG